MTISLSRRDLLTGAAVAAALAAPASATAKPKPVRFRYCLNTSTVRGQKLPLDQVIDVAAKAGYDAIEPWVSEIDDYVKAGGSLKDLAKRIRDRGLTVESTIAFPEWIVDDDARRAKGLEEARRAMDLVGQLGGTRIAAPPAGATDRADLDPMRMAERYRALLEIGDRMGVTPQAEVWGFSKPLGRLGETAHVAIQADHPKACVLPDVYHLYKGGSGFNGLRLLSAAAVHVIHVNDYPADPPRATITDAHRVFPGDGIAPMPQVVAALREIGYTGVLSLELFNRDYWKQDALTIARTGLAKMRAAVRGSS